MVCISLSPITVKTKKTKKNLIHYPAGRQANTLKLFEHSPTSDTNREQFTLQFIKYLETIDIGPMSVVLHNQLWSNT